jgi:hypothetical protein
MGTPRGKRGDVFDPNGERCSASVTRDPSRSEVAHICHTRVTQEIISWSAALR